jgi:Domain of unknown function (DUF1707)
MSAELPPAGGYRVGDAERTRTADLLKEAHVAGYLTLDEIDERLSAALAARTRDQLERLLADLPPDWRARHSGVPATAPPRGGRPPLARYLPLVLLALAMVAMVAFAVGSRGVFFPWPLLWVWFFLGRRWYRHGGWNGGWQPPRSNRVTWM